MNPRRSRWALGLLASAAAACNPQRADWGFDAIDGMATPPDPPLACGAALSEDPNASLRAACTFGTGATSSQTLGVDPAALEHVPIRHVIVLMKENRSFDHLLGYLHDRGQPGAEPSQTTWSNPDASGAAVEPFHATSTCMPWDPGHQSSDVAACVDEGRMDGFVRRAGETTGTDGHFAMAAYDAADLPFYYWLAATFAVGDRHFAPMASGTFPNRAFLVFGSNAGVIDTGNVYPPPNTPSLLQLLMNAGYTWGVYTDGAPLSGSLDWRQGDPGVHTMQSFYEAVDHGTLPNVAFVDGIEDAEDDHPPADLQRGEAWVRTVYEHARASPQWPRLAIIWTYDEAGGFADHIAPEPGCAVGASALTQRGPRVPLVAVSPWAKRNFVSHVVRDHAAITRFIEALFGLPALTARDANSDALLDLFDFSCGRDLAAPPAPAAGAGGCAP